VLGALGLRSSHAGAQASRDEVPTPKASEVEPKARQPKRSEQGTSAATREAGEDESTGSGNVIVPLVMYTPETHLGGGGFFVHFFRLTDTKPRSRVSSLAFVALATTRRQAILEMLPDLYADSDRLHAFGKFEYQHFPDSFWGIGNASEGAAEERYERERFRFRGGVQYGVVRPVYAGPYADVMTYSATYAPDGLFALQDIPGEAGGLSVGVGAAVTFDTRDNAVATRRGTLVGATFLVFSPVFGSEYTFRRLTVEARHFLVITGDHVIGFRFFGETLGGEVPYYQLAMLGGDELLRGYFLGRYRDENLGALETEYRFPLYWRFGGVAFAGAGQVADGLEDLGGEPTRWAVGAGLRFSLNDDEHLNLRLDFGVGPGTHGIYVTAREAF
jgi:hypothetical protein